ncbi:glycoside hydrolase family 2 protein [Paenibacillus nasutitermitis]|uniref:glycoside hydrolase family 2 protein n=1 Tax=Paenibacillus nasutitermitis TaxID=1652958 RepID=UPI00166F447B|nr:sugar-binding domain-containing protein [Paenibacillus nasutitermitis]
MEKISLNGEWKLYYFPQQSAEVRHPGELEGASLQAIPARVPGNVELDLQEAGEITDPYTGSGVRQLQDYELHEWWYVKEFEAPLQKGRTELVFHGVDCMATYWLNGQELGSTANMLIAHTFDVTEMLKEEGMNTLHVRLQSPILEALKYEYDPSMSAMSYNWSQLWVRKAGHGYGWDIMPRAVSAGLWREVEIVVHDEVRIKDLYFYTKDADRRGAEVGIFYQLAADPAHFREMTLRFTGTCGTAVFVQETRVNFAAGAHDFRVEEPCLWWPRGYGAANLYEVRTELLLHGKVLAERTDSFGIRKLELIRTEITSDEEPGEFKFVINGTPIFCKGSNWVPADMFHSKDAARIPAMLDLFVDMNCNMVRVWGGSVYEDHAFFERCDREGLMVWQDFSMACALYPQTEQFYEMIREEARFIVRKLRNHPSLVLWCGDNEIDQFSLNRHIDPNGNKISREVLPAVLYQCDPYRPYLPSSPYYSPEFWKTKNPALLPEEHLWGPRDYYKSRFYTGSKMHFVSEIGYHGCPNLESIEKFIEPEHLWPMENNEQWALHSSDPIGLGGVWSYRIGLMANQVKELFGEVPEQLGDFVLASQFSQAEAKKFFVEMIRLRKWRRTGILWWNMIDGWPQFSDAVVDYYGGKKLAYHYLKRVHQDHCIMIDEPDNWQVRVVLGNDSLTSKQGTYRIWDADTDETLLEGSFQSAVNDNINLGHIRISHSQQRMFFIQWTIDGQVFHNHYLLGFPGFSLAGYKKWMGKMAGISAEFARYSGLDYHGKAESSGSTDAT